MWKWLVLLSCFAVVWSDELAENDVPGLKIHSVKLLPKEGTDLTRLRDILEKHIQSGYKEQIAEINEYADDVLANLNDFIVSLGMDPIGLPGFEESFQWTIFFGWVSLDDGWLRGIASLERSEDVIVKYEYPNITIRIPIGFSNLGFDYHYEAKFMGFGPEGTADGKVKGCKFTVDLDINMTNLRVTLNRFRLNTLGKVTMKFQGSIIGKIANILIGVVIPILQPIIRIVLQGFISSGLDQMLGVYNQFMCTLLADCPELLTDIMY